jgi:hypothetical protein
MIPANDVFDLTSQESIRAYIKEWAPRLLGKEVTYVRTSGDRLIHFRNMSDEDAEFIANELRAMEMEASR